MRFIFLNFLLIFLLSGCAGIKFLSEESTKDLYSEEFLKQIRSIKKSYRISNPQLALNRLKRMDENKLQPAEKALRRNHMGVIYFSQQKYEQAIFNFELALGNSKQDKKLTAQIYLNTAGSYFKLSQIKKSFTIIEEIEQKRLDKKEQTKYYLLRYNLSKEIGKDRDSLISLIYFLSNNTTIIELKNNPYFQHLVAAFFKLTNTEKVRLLEEFEDANFLCTTYLGYLEVEKLYYTGKKDSAKDLLEWVNERSKKHTDITELVDNFFFKIINYAKINSKAIGIVTPLTGAKSKFGKRALLGINIALEKIQSTLKDDEKYKLFIKDSKGSGAVGAFSVKELIDKHHVGAIIGGLFSTEANKEYIEAKKHGVLFISLSQIYLPKEQKDHLLIEIPGSIESQVNKLFSDEIIKNFGNRAAIIYPKSVRGDAYIHEFWRKAKQNEVEVTGVLSYEKNKTDYRDPVKNLLGLKFKRERQEELDLLSEIHSLEKNTSTRRIQTLKPLVEFDWVFIPAFPKEALQILPSFTYYDAFKINFVGGPSWRSKTLSKENYKLGKLHFIGDFLEENENSFSTEFIRKFNRRPRTIEMRGFDALKIITNINTDNNFTSRDELDIFMRKQKIITGITGQWELNEGIWLKEMNTLSMRRGKITKLTYNPEENSEKSELSNTKK